MNHIHYDNEYIQTVPLNQRLSLSYLMKPILKSKKDTIQETPFIFITRNSLADSQSRYHDVTIYKIKI